MAILAPHQLTPTTSTTISHALSLKEPIFFIADVYDSSLNQWVTYRINPSDLSAVVGSNPITGALLAANNLSDLLSAATARANIGLGNVTNDTQTKASIVPNTVPSSGNILVGNGTAYASVSPSGDATISSIGVVTVAKSNGTPFGTAAFTDSSSYDPAGAAAAITLSSLGGVPTTRKVAGHALSSDVTLSSSDVGLVNVTNDTQTKASIVPNTVPSSGNILVGNGASYTSVPLSGDATINSLGAITVTNSNGISFGNAAFTNSSSYLKSNQIVSIANGGTNTNATPVAGSVVYGNGTSQAYSQVGIAGYVLVSTSSGAPTWSAPPVTNVGQPAYWGSFWDTTTQVITSTSSAYPVTLNSYDINNNAVTVSDDPLDGHSRVTVANAGVYNFQFSAQFTNSGNSAQNANLWLRKNGSDIPFTTSQATVPAKHGGINGATVEAANFVMKLNGGDYIQLIWQAESTDVSLDTIPAGTSPTTPVDPCVVVTMTQLTQIGLGYAGLTSTSTVTVGTGSKTFVTNLDATATAFTVGSRVCASSVSSPTTFVEGVITSYSGTTLNMTADAYNGSGSPSSWNFTAVGSGALNAIDTTARADIELVKHPVPSAQTCDYTLVLADDGKVKKISSGGSNLVNVPLNSSVAFSTGAQIGFIQIDSTAFTLTPAGGVTIHSASGLTSGGQWTTCALYYLGGDEWVASGTLIP